MSLVREPNSQQIIQFPAPQRGTWKSVAVHTVPPDALYDSCNVFVRKGKLRSRPGLSKLNDTVFNAPILGGKMITTPQQTLVLALSADTVYELQDIQHDWLPTMHGLHMVAPTNQCVVDTATLETRGQYVVLVAEQHSVLHAWYETPRSYTAIAVGNVPFAKSVCISVARVIAFIPPHMVQWSATLDHTSWPELAYAKLAQTGDMGICVRSLSSLAFVFYKERSIHVAHAQAGNDDTAFAFSEPLRVDGPAGIHAVVDVQGTHMYMTKNGRIALFNGTNYPQWIADGLWLHLQEDINPAYAYMIRGIYDYRLHTVTFYYPRLGEVYLTGMVIINLPYEGMDTVETMQHVQSFLGISATNISHCCSVHFNDTIDRSMVFSAIDSTVNQHQSFLVDEHAQYDHVTPYPCHFQTGLQAIPNARHSMVTVETLVERGIGYGDMLIEPVTSDGLENESGTLLPSTGQLIDLENNPVRDYKGFNKQLRFIGLKYSWLSTSTVRYAGSVVYTSGKQV